MKKKHYIFLRNLPKEANWGGCENRLLEYFSRVDHKAYRITLVSTEDIFSNRFKERKIPVSVQDFPFPLVSSSLKQFKQMSALMCSLKPDSVVFVQGAFTDFKLSQYLASFLWTRGNVYSLEVLGAPEPDKKVRKKYFKFLNVAGLWWYKKIFLVTLRGWLCKEILAVSEEVKNRLVQWYYYPARRIHAVFFGINPERFSADQHVRDAMRKKYAIHPSDQVIISTARLSKEKCINKLINAFDRLNQDFKNIWLFVVGDGPMRSELEELAQGKASDGQIKFIGYQKDVSEFLKMADIFVLPSDIEGLGSAVLEAMASELVTLATRTPGPNELIEDSKNGFLVDKNEDAIFQGLEKALMLTDDQKKAVSSKARENVLNNFNLDTRVKNALRILKLA